MSDDERDIRLGGNVDPRIDVGGGVPLAEITRMDVGPCVVCGVKDDYGMLDDATLNEQGVLVGTSYCRRCAVGLLGVDHQVWDAP